MNGFFSAFYYGHQVDETNNYIDFDEGGGELSAVLNFGSYTLSEYADEIERAMEAAGALDYEVAIDRATRQLTISADGDFDLLVATGTHPTVSAYTMMGFTGSDRTGADEYEGDSGSGSVYNPQFWLQNYVPPENQEVATDSTVLEAVDGNVEVVRFGNLEMTELEIVFATNIPQPTDGPIRSNPNGVADLNTFMRYLITKAPIEFIPDEDDPETFHRVILESTQREAKGTGYRLRERYDKGLPGYHDTGLLTFRVVNS